MSDKLAILLIEDEAVTRIDIAFSLEEAGFEVIEAPDGAKALELFDLESERISSVITDIRLGHGANGWDVARHCRQMNPTLPVVYMSGDSAGDWAAQGVPGSVMIVKPFAMAQIVTAVSTLLNALGPTLAP